MIQSLNENDKKVYLLIRNRLVHGFEAPTFREIIKLIGKTSPRSATLALVRIEKAGLIQRTNDNKIRLTNESWSENKSITTVRVPLVGYIAAGVPILAEENIETFISISTALARPNNKYFLLRVVGDSMNLAKVNGISIENGSIVLVRQQPIAENNEIVVALIDDSATVKVFQRINNMIILRPNSNKSEFKPLVLTENCIIQELWSQFSQQIFINNFKI
ncbi:MAG: repressor LexA [Bacteroidetes bacterium]|nr:repressor LexA [Bacteroidota bacterium]